LFSKEAIEYRQEGVEELVNASVVRMAIAETLHSVSDIERLSGKISNGNFNPKNCIALSNSLCALPSVKFQLLGFTSQILQDINGGLADMKEITDLLQACIAEDAPAITAVYAITYLTCALICADETFFPF
jgi:DNA mismatch repair protein MutS